jgi:5-methylcytosine-specific restriction endonuclease McrA
MSDDQDGAVVRRITREEVWTQDVYYCPRCNSQLWDKERCELCRWRSASYVPPPKKWSPNPHKRAERWAVSGGRCFYCGEHVADYHLRGLDHLIPQSRGGSHDASNLIPCCRSCNSGKKTKTLEEYRAWLRQKRYALNEYQFVWLRDLGCFVSNEEAPDIEFAFEREGWK